MGLQMDPEKAFNLYFSAAKAGHMASAYRTAMCCEMGIGTRRDPQKAMQFYRKAASLGDVASMYKLGITHVFQTYSRDYSVEWIVGIIS
jgi:TPR repeat protein